MCPFSPITTLAVMPHLSDLQWLEMILLQIVVVLQIVLLVFSIRVYRVRRTRPFALIVAACACYVVPQVTWFAFYFVRGFLSPHRGPSPHTYALPWWRYSVDQIAVILFLVLMILALRSFLREPQVIATSRI
jgi:hypothetical protein